MTSTTSTQLSDNLQLAITDLAQYLATPAGKLHYKTLYQDAQETWLEQIADADDPDYRGSADYYRDVKGNAQCDALTEILETQLHYDGSVLNQTSIYGDPMDGRRFLRTKDAAKIEAYLLTFFPSRT